MLRWLVAKRFTDTDIWKKEWFQNLSPALKCAWQYLTHNCDNAGVWSVNMRLLSFQVGEEVTLPTLLEAFADKIRLVDDDKLFIESFVEFQYGELSEECKPHKSVIEKLKKHTLWEEYRKGNHTLQDKEEEKEEEKEKDQEKEKRENFKFEELYKKYPLKRGKKKGFEICKRVIRTPEQFENLSTAIDRYAADCIERKVETAYILHFKTFMGQWEDWLDPETGTGIGPPKKLNFLEFMAEQEKKKLGVSGDATGIQHAGG
jgi:hypothetical protein